MAAWPQSATRLSEVAELATRTARGAVVTINFLPPHARTRAALAATNDGARAPAKLGLGIHPIGRAPPGTCYA
jgi:hypothetical protein